MKKLAKPLLRTACGLALCAAAHHTRAQEPPPLVNTKAAIEKGIKLFDKGEYKQALAQYRKVPEGDTNYVLAVNETILTYLADSAYTEAKSLSQEMLALPGSPYRREFLMFLGHAYDYMGRTDSAIACYDSLIRINPYDHQPYYEKGTTYVRMKQYDKAIDCFRQSLMLNPYHYRSHFSLGTSLIMEGRLSEGYLALCTSLFTTNDANIAKSSISILAAIAAQTDEVANAYRDRKQDRIPAAYGEIDQIINARLALSKEYSFKSALSGDHIINVLHAIMEKLRYDAAEPSLVMQYYVPMYTKVYKAENFEPFVLLMFSGYDIDVVEKQLKKNKDGVADMRKYVFAYLDKISGTQVLNYSQRKSAPLNYAYLPSNKIFIEGGIGSLDPLELREGPVKMYKDGVLTAAGNYDAHNKKTGDWKFYGKDGLLKSAEHYTSGEYTGTSTFYHPNGVVKEVYVFDDNGKQLEDKEYSYNGDLTTITRTRSNEEQEVTSYHPNGQREFVAFVVKKEVKDGHYQYFYDNGRISKEVTVLNGKRDGEYKEYYRNGQLSEVSHFRNGQREGAYTSYHKNGQRYYDAVYKAGELEGVLEEYNADGRRIERATMHLGKRQGADSLFTPGGRNYAVVQYKANAPYAALYTDDDGKVTTANADRGLQQLVSYYANGNKRSEISYKDGKAHGVAKYYQPTGTLRRIAHFKDGNLNGTATDYYRNGNVSSEVNNTDDVQDGYFKSYYASGKLRSEGWMKKDKKQGIWRTYSASGKLERESFYQDDELRGPSHFYNEAGKRTYSDIYDRDMIVGLIEYDLDGKERSRRYYLQGNGLYEMKYPNGKPFYTCRLLHGSYQGAYTRHMPNGTLLERGFFTYGKRDSLTEVYAPTGRLLMRSSYSDGGKNGLCRIYDEEGQLIREQDYKDNELNGKDKIYSNGLLRYESNYTDDDRNGLQLIYGDNKKPVCVLNYANGSLISYATSGKDGNLSPAVNVKNGTCTITGYYPNDKKAVELQYKDNLFEGRQVVYYSNGQPAEERSYARSDLNGPVRKWLPNGKPAYEANYTDDEYNGPELTYDSKGVLLSTVNYVQGGVLHGTSVHINPKTKQKVTVNYNYGVITDPR